VAIAAHIDAKSPYQPKWSIILDTNNEVLGTEMGNGEADRVIPFFPVAKNTYIT